MKKSRKKLCVIGNDRSYGVALKHFRKLANFTQSEAAELSGISQSAISRFEDGDNWACKDYTLMLCYVYGITFRDYIRFVYDEVEKLPDWAVEITVVNDEEETNDDNDDNKND